VRDRGNLEAAVQAARSHEGPFLLNFLVEQEDSVYPMIPAGKALHEMIRRPGHNPLVEKPEDE
jgi:acetolactate synthase-1/2/3 large subunit